MKWSGLDRRDTRYTCINFKKGNQSQQFETKKVVYAVVVFNFNNWEHTQEQHEKNWVTFPSTVFQISSQHQEKQKLLAVGGSLSLDFSVGTTSTIIKVELGEGRES